MKLELPVNRTSLKASRLLNTAAATLAASVFTDSTAEHYRAGFHNRAMFIAPTVSAATLVTATAFAFAPRRQGVLPGSVFAAAVVTGLVGFGFHLTNVSRRVGGWNSANVFHGAPIGDPKLHAHVVVGKSDGTAHGGHLLEAYVRPTLEVVVVEASQHLRRTMRGEFGLAVLDLSL